MEIDSPLPDWRSKALADLSRAERVMYFIEEVCRVPEGALVGQRVKLAAFQERFIYAIYRELDQTQVERAILSVARKNAKTATIAFIVIVHLVGQEAKQNSLIVSAATSQEQAALVFDLCVKVIQQSELLSDRIRIVPSRKRLYGVRMGTEYRALAADKHRVHGMSPILVILDEAGQIRGATSAFVDGLTTAQGAHDDPLMIVISTQAPDDGDWLSIQIDDYRTNHPPKLVCHVYEADDDCDLEDPKQWRKANPAMGLFRLEKDVQKLAADAKRMPSNENSFRNLILNQRVSTKSPFIPKSIWLDAISDDIDDDIFTENVVSAGLDLSMKKDLTALVIVAYIEEENKYYVKAYMFTPLATLKERAEADRAPYETWVRDGHLIAIDGQIVDYDHVCDYISIQGLSFDVVRFDRWGIDAFKAAMVRNGIDLPLVPHGQGWKDMSPAVDRTEQLLLERRLVVPNNPCLTWCASNATTISDNAGNRKLVKSDGTFRNKIDPIVALAMAVSATDNDEIPMDVGTLIG